MNRRVIQYYLLLTFSHEKIIFSDVIKAAEMEESFYLIFVLKLCFCVEDTAVYTVRLFACISLYLFFIFLYISIIFRYIFIINNFRCKCLPNEHILN